LIMILSNEKSIRDVIYFPFVKKIWQNLIKEYNINKIIKKYLENKKLKEGKLWK
jgi:aspartyl-tRNA synthetase